MEAKNYVVDINNYLNEVCSTIGMLNQEELEKAMNVIYDAYIRNATIYVFGNGGSASTASHMTNDFNKGVSEKRDKKFHFQCLNDNMPTLLAIANDNGYENVFSQQLENKLNGSELIIAISGSGNSPSIIKAVEYAKEQGCVVLGITGYDGGKLKALSDFSMHANIDNMQIVEDMHLIFNHMMMRIFSDSL